MKKIQRTTSFFLALIMVLGMMPVPETWAEETEPTGILMDTGAAATEAALEATEAATAPTEETTVPTAAVTEPAEETAQPDESGKAKQAEKIVEASELMDAQSAASENGFSYTVYSNASGSEAACITRYAGGDVNVVVPSSIGGYPVEKIGSNAFCDNPELESVVLSEGIAELESGNSGAAVYGAFAYCYNLKQITLPESLTKIGSYAFYDCKTLPQLELPENLTEIGSHAFYGCGNLTELEFPAGLTTVGSNALNGTGITAVSLPDSVTAIDLTGLFQQLTEIRWTAGIPDLGNSRFRDFVALETVVLPEGVTEIAEGAFASCYNLKNITLPRSLKKIGDNAFSSCKTLSQIVFPEGLEAVGDEAFSACSALLQLEFPEGLKTIGNQTFSGTGITSLLLPDSVISIDLTGLSQQLTEIRWTAGIPVLESGLFREFVALETVVLPEGVTEIAESAFACCYNLKEITLPRSLKTMGSEAFCSCKTLARIELPEQLETIGDKAFYDCASLEALDLPDGLKTIGSQAFSGTGITCLYLPDSVTAVDLTGLAYQLTEIRWTAGIPVIDNTRFQNFVSLETVVLPEGVTELADGEPYAGGISGVFAFCYNLTNLTLPGSLTKIGNFAFLECEMLEDVYYSGTESQWNLLTENMGLNNGPLVNNTTLHFDETNVITVAYVTNMEQTLESSELQAGAVLTAPVLVREGYTLCGWYTDAEFTTEWNFADPVTKDMTLYAKWQADEAESGKCMITFVVSDTEQYSDEIEIGGVISAPEVTLEGYTLCGWFTDEDLTEEWNIENPVEGNMTLYARWLPNELDKNDEDTGICIEILNEDGFVYTGKSIKPEIIVRDGGRILTAGTDYTVSYKNNTNTCDKDDPSVKDSKKPQIIVQGKGNYKSSKKITKYFTIHQVKMEDLQITLPEFVACKAKNKNQTIKAAVSTGLAKVSAANYVIHYYTEENVEVKGITEPGRYHITLEAKPDKNGNYSGNFAGVSGVYNVQAVAADKILSSAKITVPKNITAVEAQPEEDAAIKALISKVVMNKVPYLTEEIDTFKDYFVITAIDSDGTEVPQDQLGTLLQSAGKKTVIVRAKEGNPEDYLGEKTAAITVKGIALNKKQFRVTFGEKDANAVTKATYNGASQIPNVSSDLEENKDYTVSFRSGKTVVSADQVKNAGNYSLVITGKGNYSGTLTYSFSISKLDLAKANAAGELKIGKADSAVYTPLGAKVSPVVTFNNETLTEGTDFTVTFSGNKTVTDAAAMTLKGKGNFSGSLDKKKADELIYSIAPKELSGSGIVINVTGLTVKKDEITGAKYTVTHDGKAVSTKQYTGELTDNGETVRLTITGKDQLYTGSKSIEISKNLIKTSDSKKVKISLPKENRYYTGSPIQPVVTITNAEGEDISNRFTITYGENTKVGSGSITITGIPEKGYYGAKTLKFTILPKWTKWIFG